MFKALIIFSLLATFISEKKVNMSNMEQLQHEVNRANDTLYVVNFWATWCSPCVKEMPYFETANKNFEANKVKVVFVSLNSPKELEQVEKFVNDRQVGAEVKLLNAGNPNLWIDSVDKSWSGAIPATAMYRNGHKVYFREGEFTQQQLDSIIKTKNQKQ